MKSRVLAVMGQALSLVRKSNVAEATALLRDALSGAGAPDGESVPEISPSVVPSARPARRPLGEVLRALHVLRPPSPRDVPIPEEIPAREPLENFPARVYRGAAGVLGYRLHVPPDHGQRDLALLLMLHGCTQDPEDFAIGTRMNGLADEFGLVVAYPHQSRAANPNGCWNWFDKRHQHRDAGEPAKLAGLARALGEEFGIDRERTFVAGLSAGGAMAEVLAATHPDVFAAVGVHSGLPYRAATDVVSAFAAMKGTGLVHPPAARASAAECRKIVFHGGADATVHPANGERILDGAHREMRALERVHFEWETDRGHVERTVLRNADGRSVVEHWRVEGGEHAWFGGDARGTFTQDIGIDASRVMVRFFLKQ
jgi:poly(hydroxyalkanoate) depolymerase family esterase